MPLTLNVGVSKKIGQPDYGSLGASCSVEVELDASLLANDLDGFHHRVRQAYTACCQAVNDELARHQAASSAPAPSRVDAAANGSVANGQTRRRESTRRATTSQVRALHAIADRQRRDLIALLQERFSIQTAEELSIAEASSLIDELKNVASRNGAAA